MGDDLTLSPRPGPAALGQGAGGAEGSGAGGRSEEGSGAALGTAERTAALRGYPEPTAEPPAVQWGGLRAEGRAPGPPPRWEQRGAVVRWGTGGCSGGAGRCGAGGGAVRSQSPTWWRAVARSHPVPGAGDTPNPRPPSSLGAVGCWGHPRVFPQRHTGEKPSGSAACAWPRRVPFRAAPGAGDGCSARPGSSTAAAPSRARCRPRGAR